jgi:beta-galactosidase/beta-glucuronidase
LALGRVRYTRRFGLPTNLDARERVWLVIEGVDCVGAVSLNETQIGQIVGSSRSTEFDVTEVLSPRNMVSLEIELQPSESGAAPPARPGREQLAGSPIGEVRLEIRS